MPQPATPSSVKQITAQELKAMLDRGEPLELVDVRTEAERAIASIAGARHLDQAAMEDLQELDRDRLLVFQCHHGIRSQAAAHHFLSLGFRNVANLVGGIDAWSLAVDASVPRY
jgi:monothiol glutaredoxin